MIFTFWTWACSACSNINCLPLCSRHASDVWQRSVCVVQYLEKAPTWALTGPFSYKKSVETLLKSVIKIKHRLQVWQTHLSAGGKRQHWRKVSGDLHHLEAAWSPLSLAPAHKCRLGIPSEQQQSKQIKYFGLSSGDSILDSDSRHRTMFETIYFFTHGCLDNYLQVDKYNSV